MHDKDLEKKWCLKVYTMTNANHTDPMIQNVKTVGFFIHVMIAGFISL